MKVLIFAGGSGKRFWPIGRENLPKQFIQMFNGKSTFQLTIERLSPLVPYKDIFVFTHEDYKDLVYKQAPEIPRNNLYFEPYRQDVGPAVGYAMTVMETLGYKDEPVVLMWADHIVRKPKNLLRTLEKAEKIVKNKEAKGVLIGVKPTYPATNLGWIKVNPTEREDIYEFKGFIYKPEYKIASKLYSTHSGLLNTGYFVSTPSYILSFYKNYYPALFAKLVKIKEALVAKNYKDFKKIYSTMESIHFDYIVFYNLSSSEILVAGADLDWLDVGTFSALKEFYKKSQDEDGNVIVGDGRFFDSKNSMIFNQTHKKLVVGLGLEDIIIVNTKDAILVLKRSSSKKVSDVVQELKRDTKNKKYVVSKSVVN